MKLTDMTTLGGKLAAAVAELNINSSGFSELRIKGQDNAYMVSGEPRGSNGTTKSFGVVYIPQTEGRGEVRTYPGGKTAASSATIERRFRAWATAGV